MTQKNKTNLLEINNITKSFNCIKAINCINLNIESRKIYGMVGTNGSGKSTFLRMVSGVYKPDSGKILMNNESVFDNPNAKKNITFLSDEPYFPAGTTMKKMASTYELLFPSFDRKRFDKLMELFKFPYKSSILHMSKGQKRQAAIILTLSVKSPLVLFDESFDGLDPVIRSLVKQIIYEDVSNNSTSYVITSHSLKELEEICDCILLLHNGEIILNESVDTMNNIYSNVQIGFNRDISINDFNDIGLNIIRFSSSGKLANITFSNTNAECEEILTKLNPLILEISGLSLDEIFKIKAKENGYSFEIPEEF